jgi:predicted DNA-binding protein
MKQIAVAARIPPDWYRDIKELSNATGQSQSQIIQDAIGRYLKKTTRLRVVGRIDDLEDSVGNLRAVVLALAEADSAA